ncbi:hypothetical protein QAD02_009469 [Eretmocerus hayati]|uniref:Uncharacterized protein n=1 Tax=Eretmocerus hayati TaxID=131215 RepID=A0ACC2N9R8_9HYME|nr:hypothetical protein QAD02_009469 [Eretmocerus hayati]
MQLTSDLKPGNVSVAAQQGMFPNAGPMRRLAQQPIPPSGPMMRPQMGGQPGPMHAANQMYMSGGGATPGGAPGPNPMNAIGGMHQMQQRFGYPRTNNQRAPNISVANFNISGGGGIQMNAAQIQHQQMLRSQTGGVMTGAGMTNSVLQQHIMSQQHQQQQQANNQMGMQLQMSQSQSVSAVVSAGNGTGSPLHPHQQYGSGSPVPRGNLQPQIPPQQQQQQQPQQQPDNSVNASDLNFDFLDNLQTGDTSNFNPQELLNQLDSGFNLDSIL